MQASDVLRAHLTKNANAPYAARLQDFHLLLWLARMLHWAEGDVAAVAAAARSGQPIMEGYKMMIDSLAGL
jgi:nuclear protein localization protein 4 homolog